MVSMNSGVDGHPGPAAGGDDIVVVEELALDQAAHDGVTGSHEHDIAAVGADVHQLLVVVGQQVGHFGHGLAGHDDPDVLDGSDGALHDGQTIAVPPLWSACPARSRTARRCGRVFLVLTDGIQGAVDHVPQHAGLDGQGLLRAGVGQIREIGSRPWTGSRIVPRRSGWWFCRYRQTEC